MRGQEKNRQMQNLFCLIKLQLLQNRMLYLGLLLLEFGCMVFGIVANLRERVSFGAGIHRGDMGSMMQFGIMLMVLVLCLGSYNAADNKHLSMYPGVRKTRYFSRIILDVCFLFCFTAWLVVLYFVSYGIYQIIHLILPDVNLLYFFSWSYLLEGCTWIFALSAMLYGLVQLVYAIMYCLGRTGYLIAWAVVLFASILFAGMLPPVYRLLTKPLTWKETVLAYLLAGIVSVVVSSGVILWKKRRLRVIHGSVILLLATAVLFEYGLKMAIQYQDLEQYFDVVEETEKPENDKRIYKEFEISWEEGNRMEFLSKVGWILPENGGKEDLFDNRLYPEVEINSVSDVKFQPENAFDKSRVTKEKFVLRLEAVDGIYNGKPVFQEILDDIILKKEKEQLFFDCKTCYYVLNTMFGMSDKFTEHARDNAWDWGDYGEFYDGMYLKVIIDDETMKAWEEYQETESVG